MFIKSKITTNVISFLDVAKLKNKNLDAIIIPENSIGLYCFKIVKYLP
jgi:hypothetical protein